MNIGLFAGGAQTIHVRLSDRETWDYPAEWGVERISADVKRRLEDLDQIEHEWFAKLPETRKEQCRAIPPNTPFTNMPEDCVRMVFVDSHRAVFSGWESQFDDAPVSMWQVATKVAPWMLGPPVSVFALSCALLWVLAGFRRGIQ
jgi:hypothetical protein